MCKIDWNLVIQAFTAIGTIAVAVIAVMGTWIKYYFFPPVIKIVPHTFNEEVTTQHDGRQAIYYHLKVVNERPWSTVKNCKVILTNVIKVLQSGSRQTTRLVITPAFRWSPADKTPASIDFSHEEIFDFVKVVEGANQIVPIMDRITNNFQGYIEPNIITRYSLEIRAEGYKSNKSQLFEILWNGQWSDNVNVMATNLTINEVFV